MNLPDFDVLNLSDAGFPTGAHGHSAGLEYAIQRGWVHDKVTFSEWCDRSLRGAVIPLDVRAALRTWHRESDWESISDEVASFRVSALQREASAQVGRSFWRSVATSYGDRVGSLPRPEGPDQVQHPVAWGLVFRRLGLSAEALAQTWIFGALRQWTQVVIRILPLGQSDAFAAQTEVLSQLGPLDSGSDEAHRPLESFAPGFDLANLGMERLERRYFRS